LEQTFKKIRSRRVAGRGVEEARRDFFKKGFFLVAGRGAPSIASLLLDFFLLRRSPLLAFLKKLLLPY
jgi:hypothetical protein